MHRPLLASCLLLAVLVPNVAHAEADWFASLYTGDGIELRADERVFTLYALFNAMGYDDAPVARQNPLPKYQFHPVRQAVRARLLAADPELRKQADAFFDGHPQPKEHYLAYAVNSAPPPFGSGPGAKNPSAKELSDLKGLEGLLGKVWAGWKIDDVLGQVQAEYRKALKGYLAALDGPFGKAKKILRVPDDGPQSTLVLNLLEAQNEAYGVMGDGEVVIVVGPSDKPNVEGAVREYARVFLDPVVSKKAKEWAGGSALLREAQLSGAKEKDVGAYATALFTRAVALKAMDAKDDAYDAAAAQGYYGLKEIAKGFDEGRPVDGWALEALKGAETRRPAKK